MSNITATGYIQLRVPVKIEPHVEPDWYRIIAWNKAKSWAEAFLLDTTAVMSITDTGNEIDGELVFGVVLDLSPG